jgi:uncharacterized protein YkwD
MENLLSSPTATHRYRPFLFILQRLKYQILAGKLHTIKFISILLICFLSGFSGVVSAIDSTKVEAVFVKQTGSGILSSEGVRFELLEEKSVSQIVVSKIVRKKNDVPFVKEPVRARKVVASETVETKPSNEQLAEKEVSENAFFKALNDYRNKHGKSALNWDGNLADYAQERAESYRNQGGLDHHAGFNDFIHSKDGFKKLGFNALGENSGYGHTEDPASIIENSYGQSSSHNENQLSENWSHVGIGISGTATNFIFGGNKK